VTNHHSPGREPSTLVSIAAGPLVGPVLRRVVGMLAARADLPLDRLDDAVLVADLIAARAPAHVTAETVDVALEPGPRTLSLRVGPLRPGGGEALVVDAAVPGVGNVIEQLVDELTVDPREDGEFLTVRLAYSDVRL
jgi:serine/threonine-protein kinase RsbW